MLLAGKRSERHPSKGWGPFYSEWWSFCSRHYVHDDTCDTCAAGTWVNMTTHRLDGQVYRRANRLWLWWHNSPNSKAKRTLRRHLPGLR